MDWTRIWIQQFSVRHALVSGDLLREVGAPVGVDLHAFGGKLQGSGHHERNGEAYSHQRPDHRAELAGQIKRPGGIFLSVGHLVGHESLFGCLRLDVAVELDGRKSRRTR